ncbi:helix-turn-helix domain-containing protein [Agromyces seonyuensis]|uniref:Excisionase family DNA-binding protein n=1 Tax=Agromyces seonyuensis TaxID=2662446 RepID=A0A6I4P7Y8_9MICO|nr:helix-turn-helix domain-containing protein [Agromyces seonyuensis]MWB99937.1 excisionase family DNA-binding protein [Agromyces seonyuensis]
MTTDASALGRFLSVAEAAELLAVSTEVVHALIQSGELPAIQLQRDLWRIESSHLEAFIDVKYDENEALQRWNQAQFADVTEFAEARRRRGA